MTVMKKSMKLASAIGLLLLSTAHASATPLTESVQNDEARLVKIFQHLHANPEVAFAEKKTAALVAKELKSLGFEVHEGIGKTGVVAILRNGDGPTVMVRADMDALPIKEQTDLPYKSDKMSKDAIGRDIWAMHACGHDAHTTWLLGTAKQLTDRKSDWQGTLVLVAQPAEELIMGATAMVKDGLYDVAPKPDILIAAHTHPYIASDSVAISEGRRMAGTDQIDVTIHGIGGHGSTPHATKDPVVMASMAVMGYQTIVSRQVDQSQPAVLTVGAINAGNENNIIPDSATLKLNLRWFRTQERDEMIKGIKQITDNVAKMYGVSEDRMPEYSMKGHSNPVINPVKESEIAEQGLINAFGRDKVLPGFPAVMGSEDFHMLAAPYPDVPVVYIEVGAASQETWLAFKEQGIEPKYINHNPNFVVDQGTVATGTTALTAAALEFFKQ